MKINVLSPESLPRFSSGPKVAGWIMSILAGVLFLFAAFLKLTHNAMEVEGFRTFGLPIWFMYLVGLMELAGAALLLTRRPIAGAVLLCIVGLGASFEHATHAQMPLAPLPLLAAFIAAFGGYLRVRQPTSGLAL